MVRALPVIVIGAIALSLLEKVIPQMIYLLYAYPSGYLAGLFMGQKVFISAGGEVLISLATHFIRITDNCAGYGFFCLLYAIIVWYVFRFFSPARGRAFFASLLALPAVYIITIITNACRIISAHYINEVSLYVFPANFQAALHQGVGIALFLSVVMTICFFCERRCLNERSVD